jgi:hypothetical protein
MLGQTLLATLDIKSTAIEESLGTRGALEQGRNIQSYLQFSVIKWAKQCPGQNPIDVKPDEAIQI